MANVDHDPLPTEGTGAAPAKRRTPVIIGIAGLAAVLGVGGLVLSQRPTERLNSAPAPLPAGKVLAPGPSAAGESAVPGPAGTGAPGPGAAGPGALFGPVPSAAPLVTSANATALADRLATARSANHRLGTEVRRPVPPKLSAQSIDTGKLHIVESGSLGKDHKTLRVVSAPLDLTGQRELGWVADAGHRFGDATCTQQIKMSNNAAPSVRPTLLICWRVSATRSAYTVAVDLSKHPSKADSVAALDRAWSRVP